MKKFKVSLLSMLALFLVGCGGTSESEAQPTEPPLSDVQGNTEKPTEQPTEKPTEKPTEGPATEAPATDLATEAPATEVPTEPATETPTEEPVTEPEESFADLWGDAIANEMLLRLNYVIPYVDLGGKPSADFITTGDYGSTLEQPYLEISGTATYDAATQGALFTEFEAAFVADGWTVVAGASSYTATRNDLGLKVVISIDSDFGIAMLQCTYSEPFDPSVATSWPQDVLDSFANLTDGHEVPFFYMGTKAPTVTTSSTSYTFRIDGGTYNDQIETLAKAAFNGDGWTVTDNTSTSYYNYDVFDAVKDFADGCTLTATLTKSSSSTTAKAQLEVTLSETWNPNKYTDWTDDIKTEMNTYFGEVLPYVYLGTGAPTWKWYYNNTEFDITGGTWDDQVYDSVYTQLQLDTEHTWTYVDETDYYGDVTRKFTGAPASEGGSTWGVELYSTYSGNIIIEITHKAGFTPDSATDWSADILTEFNNTLGSYTIPYFYVGENPTVSTAGSYTVKLSIGTWYDQIVDLAEAAFAASSDTWTFTRGSNSYGSTFTATCTFADGTSIFVASSVDSYGAGTINFSVLPAAYTAWDATCASEIDASIDNHSADIPYVFLNAGTYTTEWKTSSYNGSYLLVQGGEYLEFHQALFETTYENAGWTVTPSTSTYGSYAEKEMDDGCKIKVKYDWNFVDIYGTGTTVKSSQLDIFITEAYDPSKYTDWSDAVKTEMTTRLGEVMPYVYLSSGTPTTSWSSYYGGYLTLKGGAWDDSIITSAEAAFLTTDGWEVQTGSNPYGNHFTARKILADGGDLRVRIGPDSSDNATMVIYTETAPTYTTTTDWSSSIKNVLSTNFGASDLPYFEIGNSSASASYSATNHCVTISTSSSSWNNQFLDNAKTVLEAAGYTTTFYIFDPYRGYYNETGVLEAYGPALDGGTFRIHLDVSGLYVYYSEKYEAPAEEADRVWSDDIQTLMTTNLNGRLIPYFYLGSNVTGSWKAGDSCLTLTSALWDNQMYADAKAALEADTNLTWTCAYQMINKVKTLVCTAEDPDDSTKSYQVNVYPDSYDARYPSQWAVVEIFYF